MAKHYKNNGTLVSPRSKRSIEIAANTIRSTFDLEGKRIPIVEILETVLPQMDDEFVFRILSVAEMDQRFGVDTYGMTIHKENAIYVREDVHEAASNGDGRHRFTLAHELGHYVLHKEEGLRLPRQQASTTVPIYQDAEWQADTFSGSLLIDSAFLMKQQMFDPAAVAHHFQTSYQASRIAIDNAIKKAKTYEIS